MDELTELGSLELLEESTPFSTLVTMERADKPGRDGLETITIAANQFARDDIELVFNGLKFESYRKNPVVLWAHNMLGTELSGGLPIGSSKKVERSGGMIRASFAWSESPFAQAVKQVWDEGHLRAASLTWRALAVTRFNNPKPGEPWARVDQSEMIEWSLVPVPADKDAVRELASRLMGARLEGLMAQTPEPDPAPAPDEEPEDTDTDDGDTPPAGITEAQVEDLVNRGMLRREISSSAVGILDRLKAGGG